MQRSCGMPPTSNSNYPTAFWDTERKEIKTIPTPFPCKHTRNFITAGMKCCRRNVFGAWLNPVCSWKTGIFWANQGRILVCLFTSTLSIGWLVGVGLTWRHWVLEVQRTMDVFFFNLKKLYWNIHKFTILITCKWLWVPSHCCATVTTIHLWNFVPISNSNPAPIKHKLPIVLPPQPLRTIIFLFCLYGFYSTSYEWDHAIFLLWLAGSTLHNVFKVHPCCSRCRNFLPWYVCTIVCALSYVNTFCLSTRQSVNI